MNYGSLILSERENRKRETTKSQDFIRKLYRLSMLSVASLSHEFVFKTFNMKTCISSARKLAPISIYIAARCYSPETTCIIVSIQRIKQCRFSLGSVKYYSIIVQKIIFSWIKINENQQICFLKYVIGIYIVSHNIKFNLYYT